MKECSDKKMRTPGTLQEYTWQEKATKKQIIKRYDFMAGMFGILFIVVIILLFVMVMINEYNHNSMLEQNDANIDAYKLMYGQIICDELGYGQFSNAYGGNGIVTVECVDGEKRWII